MDTTATSKWSIFLVHLDKDADGTTDVPLSQQMWEDSSDTANKVYNTSFVQGLRQGTLNPTEFGAYALQDAVYLEKVADILEIAKRNVSLISGIDFRAFFFEKIEHYMRYADGMYESWQIGDSSGVKLGSGCSAYVDYKIHVAETMDPIYTVVAMIPCVKLWPWIGQQFQNDSNPGVYKKWVSSNFDPKSDGYKGMDTLVDTWNKRGLVNAKDATNVYRECMEGEFLFFSGAA